MRLRDFAPLGSDPSMREDSAGESSFIPSTDDQLTQNPSVPGFRFPATRRLKPDPTFRPKQQLFQGLTLPNHFENTPVNVKRLIQRIQFCYNRGLRDLTIVSCRTLFEVSVFEFLKKNFFPQLDTEELLRRPFQFWIDSLCRWAPPMLLSYELCDVIRNHAAQIAQSTGQILGTSQISTSPEEDEDLILNTLNIVRTLFPAGADHH